MSASRLFGSSRHKYFRLLATLLVPVMAICFVIGGRASPKAKPKPWLTKDWTEWTADDCGYVLNGSPWSLQMDPITVSNRPGEFNTSYILVQLRSALPVRQALLRTLQIEKHYDKMDDQKKREFDQQNSAASTESATNNVVILVDNVTVYNGGPTTIAPRLPTQIALEISGGPLVLPVRTRKVDYPPTQIEFDAHQNQFEYVFPRVVGGKPLCSPGDSFLGIDLGDPLIVDKKTGQVKQQDFRKSLGGFMFNISDLIYKGKLEY